MEDLRCVLHLIRWQVQNTHLHHRFVTLCSYRAKDSSTIPGVQHGHCNVEICTSASETSSTLDITACVSSMGSFAVELGVGQRMIGQSESLLSHACVMFTAYAAVCPSYAYASTSFQETKFLPHCYSVHSLFPRTCWSLSIRLLPAGMSSWSIGSSFGRH